MRKRILGIFLSLILTAGMFVTPAFAGSVFPDVSDSADYAKLTKEMGIFAGDNKGNFNPDKGITRAECAVVVYRLLGETADAATMTTNAFTDVPKSHWANGYIAWAYSKGFISGYGNGKFGPSDMVTYEQAITMLMAGIDYGSAAVDAGGYPYGYISVAERYGFLAGVEDTFGSAITRANIAVLLANIVST